MSDGRSTPGSHDGMAAFRINDRVRIVRNHERGGGTPFAPSGAVYDAAASGGTTTLVFDPDAGRLVESYASLSGTIRNCAGGPTPSSSWLTCEETTDVIGTTRHGYIFEVPATGTSNAVPLKAMGRFSHEATATDPSTGIVYETEDDGSSAFYRYIPTDPSNLAAGGRLEAMVLEGTTDTINWTTGVHAKASWVTVDNPDWAPGEPSCRQQASAKGAARISRGEGAWHGNGVIYVISTSGGPARQGQVFAYDDASATFTCIYASPSADVLNAPDNVCVSPRGGLVLCEDGSGREYLHGLTPDGQIFQFAENNAVLPPEYQTTKGYSGDFSGSEWAGATFEPKNGNWLFANLQSPGITFAITGPWRQGAL
jgi:secreted PhoX family phosphatase